MKITTPKILQIEIPLYEIAENLIGTGERAQKAAKFVEEKKRGFQKELNDFLLDFVLNEEIYLIVPEWDAFKQLVNQGVYDQLSLIVRFSGQEYVF